MTYAVPASTSTRGVRPAAGVLARPDEARALSVGRHPWDFVSIKGDLISIDTPPLW